MSKLSNPRLTSILILINAQNGKIVKNVKSDRIVNIIKIVRSHQNVPNVRRQSL
jgi:hypothetical protein